MPDAGSALSYGWNTFKANPGPLIAIVAVPVLIEIVVSLLTQFVFDFSIVLVVLLEIIGVVLGTIAALGIHRSALLVTAGEGVDFAKAFQYDRWGEWFVFSIVFGLMVAVGLALCVIPGLLVIAFFGLAPYYFIDQRMSLGDALRASREAAGSKNLAFPILLSVIVGFLGILACGVGYFVTAPVAYLAVAFLYRYAQGQAVAS
jgi:uncharacterized membrane protein